MVRENQAKKIKITIFIFQREIMLKMITIIFKNIYIKFSTIRAA